MSWTRPEIPYKDEATQSCWTWNREWTHSLDSSSSPSNRRFRPSLLPAGIHFSLYRQSNCSHVGDDRVLNLCSGWSGEGSHFLDKSREVGGDGCFDFQDKGLVPAK